MPLIEAQYASEDGHRTARVYLSPSGQWRVIRWEWKQNATEITYPSEGHASRADAELAAEAWVGDREG